MKRIWCRIFGGVLVSIAVFLISCGGMKAAYNKDAAIPVLQKDVLAKLTGRVEISQSLIILERSTPENREASRTYLVEVFNKMGLEGRRHTYRENGENVYCLLSATEPSNEYIILGAHFDSVRDCPGANDNATGVAVVLGAAQTLKQLPKRSKNIYFVLFDEEERGMQGSRSFAQKMVDDKINVVSVHTIDQMGWDNDGDRAIELEVPYEEAFKLYTKAVQNAGFSITIHQTRETGSDHSSFRRLNFKAVGLTEEYRNGDTTPYIHKNTDGYDTVNFEYMLMATKIVIEAMKLLIQ